MIMDYHGAEYMHMGDNSKFHETSIRVSGQHGPLKSEAVLNLGMICPKIGSRMRTICNSNCYIVAYLKRGIFIDVDQHI